ncbi:HET domain-containing protein [Aspergillus alliaceus]|uniref:HET domain-containing protein n=1 Tax=Petromyces alliaceus TaxID=209559 RepID=UPI0012A6D550|nr:heterokaryon incompatibility protein-domain-containing protein [Aspergillus alliaceus]KAB8226925.1 heterokaryon incompatibility protein-domain-containing protein [Aspergillus alliaceus]
MRKPGCPNCHDFEPEATIGQKQRVDAQVPRHINSPNGFLIVSKIREIQEQASKGCSSCLLLYKCFLEFRESDENHRANRDDMYLQVELVSGRAAQVTIYSPRENTKSRDVYSKFHIFAVAGTPNPWPVLFKAPSSPKFALTDERQACFNYWIQNCRENHPSCQRPRFMPKRLVDVGLGNRGMCLVEDVHPACQYVALSHCWEFSEAATVQTTKRNLEETKAYISYMSLSKTFRDAVDICKWLDVPYLWVDSICIVQDDPGDWIDQATAMGSIYEGAYVTIAAHFDPNGTTDDGCCLNRRGFSEIVLNDATGTPFSTFIKWSDSHDISKPQGLMSRAWCIQERLLSPRVLHFRQGEVIFECSMESKCECGTLGIQLETMYHYKLKAPEKRLIWDNHITESPPGSNIGTDVYSAWGKWRAVVRLYSAANLTVETDRLPALSGLAQRSPKRIFGDYIAGLWSNDLPKGLLRGYGVRGKVSRAQLSTAPSFCWTSLHGEELGLPLPPYSSSGCREAKILELQVVPATKNPTGSVKNGLIRLQAWVMETKIISVELDSTLVTLGRIRTSIAHIDVPDEKKALAGSHVYAVEILGHELGIDFLLVKISETVLGAFERVGKGHMKSPIAGKQSHLHGAVEREMSLV